MNRRESGTPETNTTSDGGKAEARKDRTMTEELKEARNALLESFPDSFINSRDEFIAHAYSNQYIILGNCETPEDIECKVLEWFSRPSHKTAPYSQEWRNRRFHKFMLDGMNAFLETNFTEEDASEIYDRLGNAINHELTKEFVKHGMNIEWLKARKETEI